MSPDNQSPEPFDPAGEAQIERSETLSALASYFKRWMPTDTTLVFESSEGGEASCHTIQLQGD